jgi:hypothetical protein
MRLSALLLLCLVPSIAVAQSRQNHAKDQRQQQPPGASSEDQALVDRAMSGGTGECSLQDATKCATCACQYYVKTKLATRSGHGWPLNPQSRDSTGCVSTTKWGGYTKSMATPSLVHNAAEQMRDALASPADPCGLKQGKDRKLTPEMVLGAAKPQIDPRQAPNQMHSSESDGQAQPKK